VAALLSGGSYAQYVKVHRGHTIPIPSEFSWDNQAKVFGAIPEVWCTAYQLLNLVAGVKEGETALIHAAAAGVGTSML
jgi:NADPH:quinone reductase-like Zn-dependent oxidoreductase